jgi:hypothetical protein
VLQPPDGRYNYDTQFILKGRDLDVNALREAIAEMGDSVLVVGDPEAIKVHVHCDHPGNVLEYGLSHGQLTDVVIENMQLQYEAYLATQRPVRTPPMARLVSEPVSALGVVAVGSGEGICGVMASLGAGAIVPGGQTMNPSTREMLQAVVSVPQQKVIILPNNKNVVPAAKQVQELTSKKVKVVPTQTVPQGVAALLAFNYDADLKTNAATMENALPAVKTIEVTRAVRPATIGKVKIKNRQAIAFVDGELMAVGEKPAEVLLEVLRKMDTAKSEIVTVYYGKTTRRSEAEGVAEGIRKKLPDLEVELVYGGQPHYNYIASVE